MRQFDEPHRIEHAQRGSAAVAAPVGADSTAMSVLQMQAIVGNAAVTSLFQGTPSALQRQPTPPAPSTPAPTAGGGAAPAGGTPATTAAPSGPPPPLSTDEDASFESQGTAAAGKLTGGQSTSGAAGHTPGGPIAGFPEWFRGLQDTLVNRTTWTQDEEAAQQVLFNYAMKRFAVQAGGMDKVPPTIRVYCLYIGRSTANQRAAAAGGFRSSANVGGAEGAKMWCAAAGSSSVQLALKSIGLMIAGDSNAWLMSPPGIPKVPLPQAAVDADIMPGDQISYVGGGAPAIGGHTVTSLSEAKGEGSVFDHASGNAGGGTSGSIRLGSSWPRAKVPSAVTWQRIQTETPAALGAPSTKTWVYVIVKYSVFWEDLGRVDVTKPDAWTSGDGAAFLKKYKLAVRPAGAAAP